MAPQASKPSHQLGAIARNYLLIYNFLLVLGWLNVLILFVKYLLEPRPSNTLWEQVRLSLLIFQNAALLEIVHVMFKLVPSGLFTTTFQVLSRVVMVCGVLEPTPTAPTSIGLPMVLFAWSVTEIIRYLYYALNLIGGVPYLLVWCRYSFFVVLYPIGVSGELLCFYAALPYVNKSKLWSLEMPNSLNFTFSYYYFMIINMLLYVPLFPKLFMHMVKQRQKILGTSVGKKTK